VKRRALKHRVAGLEPGDEISALEGVDLEGEKAVVVEVESNGDDTSTLTLLFPDLNATSQVTVSDDSLTSVEPSEHGKQIPSDVIDTLRSTSPNRVVPVIRDNVPDTFFPPDPNGTESDLTTTLWRPTVRRTPYLNVLQAQASRRRRAMAEDEVEKIPTSTFPATLPPEADQHRPRSSTRLDEGYSDGSPRRPRHYNKPYEVRYDRSQHPVVDLDQTMLPDGGWSEEEEQHLAELADLFWTSYKEAQLTVLPSRPGLGHSGLHLDDWAIIWQQETPISVEEMDELFHYMIAARMATATVYRAWRDKLRENMLHPTRTPGHSTHDSRYLSSLNWDTDVTSEAATWMSTEDREERQARLSH
jgi:hypothetical protein